MDPVPSAGFHCQYHPLSWPWMQGKSRSESPTFTGFLRLNQLFFSSLYFYVSQKPGCHFSSFLPRGKNVFPHPPASHISFFPFITFCCLHAALGFSNFKFPGFESALLSEPMWLQTVLPPFNAGNKTKPGLFPV